MGLLSSGAFNSRDYNGVLRKIAVYVLGGDTEWSRVVRDDDNGVALAPRATAEALIVDTAGTASTTPIPASTTAVGFQFQNLSEDTVLWWNFGSDATALAAFKLFPGQYITLEHGDTHCRDAISVVTESGTAPFAFQRW